METTTAIHRGDADVAHVAALFADRTRARVLVALADGRSLPAGVLATEAGVSAQAASAQLARLREGGLIDVEQSGRHRYYRLASDQVATILEALAVIAPTEPVRSLREGTRAAALRRARTCYDHLAGRLGCAVTTALLEREALVRTDEGTTTERRPRDHLSSRVADAPYELGPAATDVLAALGLPHDAASPAGARPLLRFCVDWSEQRHHLGGRLGADLLTRFLAAGWVARRPRHRAVDLTELGADRLKSLIGVEIA
ncbi:ArsR family transcriptional regulator [Aeromicrobium sp. Root344]|uniref:ArsR/SmtB family transcription factor n=1 Tax=Aeromicrobium sp. Root344 TaxID=1736521 RepID=UPI000700856B|nr:helix-turn-helix transcriptional regulator [Aeromicrobium sp. Root344]KQV74456.1 ArsR family transcriptional regulator [Aeromicrobium sp. Root344]